MRRHFEREGPDRGLRLRFDVQETREGEYSGFQVNGMIEWGQKWKPKKLPWASNKTQKTLDQNLTPKQIPRRIMRAIKISRKH